jgi:hypothetical protein
MANKLDPDIDKTQGHVHERDETPPPEFANGVVQDENTYAFSEDRKLGVTGAVFLILNKMIGTGIFSTPSGIFAATGSVGVSLFLWVIGTSLLCTDDILTILTIS